MSNIQRFKTKSVFVEAIHFDGKNGEKIAKWCKGTYYPARQIDYAEGVTYLSAGISVPTSHGANFAYVGDWVVKIKDKLIIMSNDDFNDTYVKAT